MKFPKHRKGIASMLGTLIFIGILFSAVIPMTFVMKQADTLYAREIHEFQTKSEDRFEEDCIVQTYPGSGENEIMVKIKNLSPLPIHINRVWINDEYYNESEVIDVSSSEILDPFYFPLSNGSYQVKVITTRGNSFSPASGSMYYSNGVWSSPGFAICVFIMNNQGRYRIEVDCLEDDSYDTNIDTGFVDHRDVIKTILVSEDPSCTYHVYVEKKGQGWESLIGPPGYIFVEFNWPDEPPIEYIYINGESS
jgi:hypothetical protein